MKNIWRLERHNLTRGEVEQEAVLPSDLERWFPEINWRAFLAHFNLGDFSFTFTSPEGEVSIWKFMSYPD